MRNRICRITGLVFLIVGLPTLALALDPPVSTDSFVGTWQGQFQGKTFVTVKLVNQEGRLTGTVSHRSIQLDSTGELTSAAPSDGADPIIDATLKGNTLRITSKNQESQDIDQCEMKLTGADQADLQLLGAPSGTPTPKPWKLTRMADASHCARTGHQIEIGRRGADLALGAVWDWGRVFQRTGGWLHSITRRNGDNSERQRLLSENFGHCSRRHSAQTD